MSYIFTSESVSAGHPDKICDQISDAVLDACLIQDKNSRVACETMVKNNNVVLAGEITTIAEIDYEQIARSVVKDIGYDHDGLGFSYDSFRFTNYISEQSQDISEGIAQGEQLGSGDQGIMFGYACRETSELMPLPIALAHQLTLKHEGLRQDRSLGLRPDAKSQVAVEYNDNYQPQRIDSIVFSSQHDPDLSLEQLRELIREEIIQKTLQKMMCSFGYFCLIVTKALMQLPSSSSLKSMTSSTQERFSKIVFLSSKFIKGCPFLLVNQVSELRATINISPCSFAAFR